MEREIRSNLTNAFSVAHQAGNSDACADVDQHRQQETFVTPALRHSLLRCTELIKLGSEASFPVNGERQAPALSQPMEEHN